MDKMTSNLRQLKKLDSINGNETRKNRRVMDVQNPRNDQDATTKKWVTDNFVGI